MKRMLVLAMLLPVLAGAQLSKQNIFFVTAGDSAAAWFVTTTDMQNYTDTMFTKSDTLLGFWVTRATLNGLLADKQAAGTYLVPSDTSSLTARFAAKQAAGTYLIPSDTSSLVARFAAKQAAGTYLIPSDTSSLVARFAAKQAAGTYLVPSDTNGAASRTYVAAYAQPLGTYLSASDSSGLASRTYVAAYAQPLGSYLAASDSAGLASRTYVGAYAQPLGTYIVPGDTTTSRTYSSSIYSQHLSGAGEPSSALGKNGDIYWDTTNLYEWRKVAGTWRQQP